MNRKRAIVLAAAACGVFGASAPIANAEPTHRNCFVQGNGLCGGVSLHGEHIIVTRGRPYRIRLYWPYPSNWVTTFRTKCPRPRGATVIRATEGNTDYAYVRTCRHTYKVGIS